MATQIIDGFQVNIASPIDNRIVASGSSARNAIPYKYDGLRVFDTFDGIPYVWFNGAWVSENSSGVSGAGTANYIPLFTNTNIIGSSIVYQSTNKIGVNTTTPTETFEVNGNSKATNFIGNGAQITSLNATNISSGTLALDKLTNGSTGYLLSGGSPNPVYVNPLQVTVGTSSFSLTASSANNVNLSTIYTGNLNLLMSTSSSGLSSLKTSTLQYDAANSNLITGAGSGDTGVFMGNAGACVIIKRSYFGISYTGGMSQNPVIGSITLAPGAACILEITVVSKCVTTGRGGLTSYRQNKIISAYYNGGVGITQNGTPSTTWDTGVTTYIPFVPSIDYTSTTNTINVKQTFTAGSAFSVSSSVDFRMTLVNY